MSTCSLCDRPSCRPEEYEPLCAKHYLQAVDRATAEAAARFKKRVEELEQGIDSLSRA